MGKRRQDGLFLVMTGLLCVLILAAGGILCVGYYARGYNLRSVDMQQYARVDREEQVYTVSVDADALIRDYHLPNPKTTSLNLSRYPDVQAVYSLTFLVFPQEDGGWLIQTASERETVAEDLRRGGLRLINTEWRWSKEQMQQVYEQGVEYPRRISVQKYLLCDKNAQGAYVLTLDRERLLRACEWELPAEESLRQAHPGYQAVMSLGCYVTSLSDGYLVETSSTIENVYEILLENGVRLTDTTWTYTAQQTQSLYEQQQAEQAALAIEPTAAPEATSAQETAANGLLTSLYHVNQMPYRTAIAQAKRERYGSVFQSSQIVGEWFAVGGPSSAHGNCFRLAYAITTTAGKEYLVADLYDVTPAAPGAGEVKLRKANSQAEAAQNQDFLSEGYTVYPLAGGSMVYGQDGGASPFNADGLIFPQSLSQPLTEEDVFSLPIPADKTLLQLLGYARNEIFARCGNRFSDTSVYTKYYSNFSWYQPKDSVSVGAIRESYPVAAENIQRIKEWETLLSEG